MPLSPQERAILTACEMEADLVISEIAKRSQVAEHVARRTLARLQDSGMVTRRHYLNSFLLGTPPYLIAFTLSASGLRVRDELHHYLLSQPQVGFIAQVSGSYNLFFEVRASTMLSLQGFLDRLSTRFGPIFVEKQILALTSMNDFPVTATAQERPTMKEFASALVNEGETIDKLDSRILQTLGMKWEDSVSSLARILGQPTSTVEYHLKKLRDTGIILGARYFVNLQAIGEYFFYHLVATKGFHPELRSKLLEFARSQTCCNTFRTFIGPWDVVFECHYDNPQASVEFVQRLLAQYDSVITKVETLSVLAHHKGSDCTVSQ
jgi:DNA-binding Lrp family transcriptional regulator